MPLLVSIMVALAALLCFVRPAVGFIGYLAVVIIRPNELMPDMLLPAAPVMILAAGFGYLINISRGLPRIGDGARSRSALLIVIVLAMLVAHMLLLHRDRLVDWVLDDVAAFALMLLYMRTFYSAPEQLPLQLGSIMTSAGLMAILPLFIHFFFQGPLRLLGPNHKPLPFPSRGKLWDMYHFEGKRLMGRRGTMWANPNYLGMTANFTVPGAIYNLRKKGGKLAKLIYLAIFAGAVTTLILTGSRAGQLQFGIILWMVFVGGRRKALGIVLLVAVMGALTFVLPRLEPQRADAGASSAERGWVLSAGVAMFKSSPLFGVGFQSYTEHSPKRLNAHNIYMQSLAETGLVGFTLFMALMYFLRRETSAAVRFFENGPDPNTALAARCIGAMQFGFTIYGFFANVFMTFIFAIPMTTAVGLHYCMRRQRALQEKAQPAPAAAAGEAQAEPQVQPASEIAPRAKRLPAPVEAPALPPHAPDRWVFDPSTPDAGLRRLGTGEASDDDPDDPQGR
jgi:O-antigen ligase